MAFTHLHLHTEYSLLDGACRIGPLVSAAKKLGQTHLAITDHGAMYGVADFYKEAKKQGIHPVLGCEVYVAPRSRFDRQHSLDSESNHLILLCETQQGYRNLMKLVSYSFTEGFYSRPRVDRELLERYHEGLIALSACLAGEIPRALLRDDYAEARRIALWYEEIFGKGNYFLEIQDHGMPEQKRILPLLRRLSEETGIPLVATNDVHYIERADSRMQQVLMCVATNTTVDDPGKLELATDEFYLKSEEEMAERFRDFPGAVERTEEIARRCNVEIEFGRTKLPRFDAGGRDHLEYMREICMQGVARRYGENPSKEVLDRLEYELKVISDMGYVDYFLIVWDFIRYAREKGIPVGPGRGSGAGSLCAYLMGITGMDPIRYKLIFERFLNPERVSMPDFDIDFCYVRRQEVIDYVIRKYGADHVAQIITFGTLAARAAIRDVGRALGVPYAVCDQIAKLVPMELGITVRQALEKSAQLREKYDTDPQIKELIDMAVKVEGMPRHASTHAAGVVITDKPVSDYVPLARNDEAIVAQFPMTTLEELGLLKMDFLGLRFLTVVHDAAGLVQAQNPDFDIDKIPLDDREVYAMLSAGNTTGIFQFESGGMRSLLMRLRPQSLEDLIAVIALFRPGPMDSIPRYIQCRHDPKAVRYAVPQLEPILDVTYGCLVYQEQVMQVFRELAGYSLGRADIVRRAMAKKKHEVMERERKAFVYGDEEAGGCAAAGIPPETANRIFDEMSSFASYAFPKAHAAAYAYLSYQTSYLKTHYPREYFAALLTSVLHDTGRISEYVAECTRLKIPILPPDVNRSGKYFTVEGGEKGGIRFSLLAIKNLGEGFIDGILEEREQNGPFASLYEFCDRLYGKELNRRGIEGLIKSGAADSIAPNRRQALEALPGILDLIKESGKYREGGQLGLFDVPQMRQEYKMPDVPDMDIAERLSLEKAITGMYLSGHPLEKYRGAVERLGAARTSDILEAGQPGSPYFDHSRVGVVGIIGEVRLKPTRSGGTMAYVMLEDFYGELEMLVFPRILEENSLFFVTGQVIHALGRISLRDDREPQLICEQVSPVESAVPAADVAAERRDTAAKNTAFAGASSEAKELRFGARPQSDGESAPPADSGKKGKAGLYLRVPSLDSPDFRRAMNVLQLFGGEVPLILVARDTGKKLLASRDRWVSPNEPMLRELRRILGSENVRLVQ